MRYYVFNTKEEAINAEIAVSKAMGFGGENQTTTRWDIPQEIVDGRWVFLSPDNVNGIELENSLWINNDILLFN